VHQYTDIYTELMPQLNGKLKRWTPFFSSACSIFAQAFVVMCPRVMQAVCSPHSNVYGAQNEMYILDFMKEL
jgi:hypothetical protein